MPNISKKFLIKQNMESIQKLQKLANTQTIFSPGHLSKLTSKNTSDMEESNSGLVDMARDQELWLFLQVSILQEKLWNFRDYLTCLWNHVIQKPNPCSSFQTAAIQVKWSTIYSKKEKYLKIWKQKFTALQIDITQVLTQMFMVVS